MPGFDPQTLRLMQLQGLVPTDPTQGPDDPQAAATGVPAQVIGGSNTGLPTASSSSPLPSPPTPSLVDASTAQALSPPALSEQGQPQSPQGNQADAGKPLSEEPRGSSSVTGAPPSDHQPSTGAGGVPDLQLPRPGTPTWEQAFGQAMTATTQQAFADVNVDPHGRPTDVAAAALALGNQAYNDKLHQLALDGSLQQHKLIEGQPYQEQHAAEVQRIADETQRTIRQYQQGIAETFKQAQTQISLADANHPDPDTLFGGKGTWRRALTFALSAGSAGVSPESISRMLETGLAGQNARYSGLKDNAANMMNLGKSEAESLTGISNGFDAMQKAAGYRLAGQLEAIAAKYGPGELQASMLKVAADLKTGLAKDTMDHAVKMADVLKAEAEANKNNAEAGKFNRAGMGGGGGAMDRTVVMHPITDINKVPEKDQAKIVKTFDGRQFYIAQSDQEGEENRKVIRGIGGMWNATKDFTELLNVGGGVSTWNDIKARLGANSEQAAKLRAQLKIVQSQYAAALGEKVNPRTMAAFDKIIDDPTGFHEQDLQEVLTTTNGLLDTARGQLGIASSLIPKLNFPDPGAAPPAEDADVALQKAQANAGAHPGDVQSAAAVMAAQNAVDSKRGAAQQSDRDLGIAKTVIGTHPEQGGQVFRKYDVEGDGGLEESVHAAVRQVISAQRAYASDKSKENTLALANAWRAVSQARDDLENDRNKGRSKLDWKRLAPANNTDTVNRITGGFGK